jgi:uncharacterized protein
VVPGNGRALNRLRDGVRLFDAGEFFACHEVWEDAWREAEGPERLFLQALIHIAVSFHHERLGNTTGARRQMRKALGKLAGYLPEYAGIDTGAIYAACVLRAPGSPFPRIGVILRTE